MNNLRDATIVVLAIGMAYSLSLTTQISPPQGPSPSETRAAIAAYGAALATVVGEEHATSAVNTELAVSGEHRVSAAR